MYFNNLADFVGAHQYPYGEYSERRGGMRAVKMQKPGLDTGLKALSLRGLAFCDAFCNPGGDFAGDVSAAASRMGGKSYPLGKLAVLLHSCRMRETQPYDLTYLLFA
jgi:hypothetical protein